MAGGAARLVRGPEGHRATFLDLFLDLVFVFALFRLSQGLLEHLNWSGAFQTLLLLLAVWRVWTATAVISDRFDSRRPAIQVLVIGCMFGSMVLAAATPKAFGEHGLLFAGTYVAAQIGRSLFLLIVTRGDKRQRLEMRELFWYGVSAVPCLRAASCRVGRVGCYGHSPWLWTMRRSDSAGLRRGWAAPVRPTCRSRASTWPSGIGSSSSSRSAS